MKIMIVSDTHRDSSNFMKALDRERPIDMLIHCGDIEGDEYLFYRACEGPVNMVAGNNDYYSDLPGNLVVSIGRYKALITHGHRYKVALGAQMLLSEARERGVDIVMHGHTHRPGVTAEGGVTIVSPGSLTYPRQEGRQPSYIIMTVEPNTEPVYEIKYISGTD